jgi:hypothetical protein
MGSAHPVRRFHALRGFIHRTSNAAEAAPGPPCAFLPLQRHPAAAPPRSVPRHPEVGATGPAMLPLLGFPALRHIPGTAVSRWSWWRIPPPPRATSEVSIPPSRPSPPILPAREAPERPWASPSKAFPSHVSGTPLGAPALLTLPEVRTRGARTQPTAFRALLPRRVRPDTGSPEGDPAVDAFLGFPPPERSPHPSGLSLVVAMPALTSFERGDVPTRLDLRASRSGWIGLVRFRTAGSPGVLHLATVAAHRSPCRGAGSWLRLARENAQSALPPRSWLPRQRCSRGS